MEETMESLNKEQKIIKKKESCEDEKKVRIHKKIVIKCNDYDKFQESLNLINLDSINQITKQKPFIAPEILQKKFEQLSLKRENSDKDDLKETKEQCKYLKFPSRITQITIINKDGIKSYETDYSKLNPKVYEKFKKNITKELDILIGNAGITFNKSPIMNNIVSHKLSQNYYLLDRI